MERSSLAEEFYSDKSRITFCSSFRRLMQKAQVFSLETNSSVRNRLTHSLEVADVGRTIARRVGQLLHNKGIATFEDIESIQTIVENACLIHDLGNPPFGHFGEDAIKKWFREKASDIFKSTLGELDLDTAFPDKLYDLVNFDGNPQGFRIVTKLHSENGLQGLNLTHSTLLASVKYPNAGKIDKSSLLTKKVGVFKSEEKIHSQVCKAHNLSNNKRYFLAYLMEVADDICYCLSDIADSFEKRVITSREFKDDFRDICTQSNVNYSEIIPEGPIKHFGLEVAVKVSQQVISEASTYFIENLELFIRGDAPEIIDVIPSGKILKCFKKYARQYIYTSPEAQKIEIAGSTIVSGLLEHYGMLLRLSREDFTHFAKEGTQVEGKNLDIEWRVFSQISKRMVKIYSNDSRSCNDENEWVARARLIVDYIAGMTDLTALNTYQNFMGISLG
jgi:dGTPase